MNISLSFIPKNKTSTLPIKSTWSTLRVLQISLEPSLGAKLTISEQCTYLQEGKKVRCIICLVLYQVSI